MLLSYWIDNTLFRQMQVLLVHFVYYNMVLKMSYPLSHTVVNKKKKKKRKEKKNNRNKLSRSVANGKQYKHQHTFSYSSQFIVKRPVS